MVKLFLSYHYPQTMSLPLKAAGCCRTLEEKLTIHLHQQCMTCRQLCRCLLQFQGCLCSRVNSLDSTCHDRKALKSCKTFPQGLACISLESRDDSFKPLMSDLGRQLHSRLYHTSSLECCSFDKFVAYAALHFSIFSPHLLASPLPI